MDRSDKIYLVTHSGLTVGHQITQTAHVIAELAIAHPEHFATWHDVSQSIIVLSAPSSEELFNLYISSLAMPGVTAQVFREPDLGDEITALAFIPSPQTVRFLSNLPLSGRKSATSLQEKHERLLKKESLAVQQTPEFTQGQVKRDAYLEMYARNPSSMEPPTWAMDRALTFSFLPEAGQRIYGVNSDILSLLQYEEELLTLPSSELQSFFSYPSNQKVVAL